MTEKSRIIGSKSLDLSCILTEEERNAKAREAVAAVGDISREEERQKEVKASMKAAMEKLVGRLFVLRSQVETGFETRPVTCDILHDFDAGTVSLVRRDTGEIAEVRPMHEDERQAPMFDEEN